MAAGTWEILTVPGADKLDFRGLFAFDERTAVLMSAGEASEGLTRMYRTADAGQTWQTVFATEAKGVFLDGVLFWDRTNGLAVGDQIEGKWYLLRTRDGGQSWQRVPPAGLPAMLPNEGAFAAGNTSMAMAGSSKVWLASGAAERARIFISTDRAQRLGSAGNANARRNDSGDLRPAIFGRATRRGRGRRLQAGQNAVG